MVGAVTAGATLVVGAALHGSGSTTEARTGTAGAGSGADIASPHRASDATDSGVEPGSPDSGGTDTGGGRQSGAGQSSAARGSTGTGGGAGAQMAPSGIPGVGELMMSQVPSTTRQVIVVTAADEGATTNRVGLWRRADDDSPWTTVGTEIAGRNGANGWTRQHVEGDRRSPVGVFSLTAAGGRRPDPGTRLPYEYRPSYYQAGDYKGDPMAEAFNYVIAIDYNRLPGYPPSDPTRPLGLAAGGDIWLHVDHSSPTRGCISVPQEALESILRWLSPADNPMIIMGDRMSLMAADSR